MTTFASRRLALGANLGGFPIAGTGLWRDWNGSVGILNSAVEL
jgi:hypothetical protein